MPPSPSFLISSYPPSVPERLDDSCGGCAVSFMMVRGGRSPGGPARPTGVSCFADGGNVAPTSPLPAPPPRMIGGALAAVAETDAGGAIVCATGAPAAVAATGVLAGGGCVAAALVLAITCAVCDCPAIDSCF